MIDGARALLLLGVLAAACGPGEPAASPQRTDDDGAGDAALCVGGRPATHAELYARHHDHGALLVARPSPAFLLHLEARAAAGDAGGEAAAAIGYDLRLHGEAAPELPAARELALRLSVLDRNGAALDDLVGPSDGALIVYVVRDDLAAFTRVPTRRDPDAPGVFTAHHRFEGAGRYRVVADFASAREGQGLFAGWVTVTGARTATAAAPADLTLTLDASPVAMGDLAGALAVTSGPALAAVDPILGSAAHVFAARDDLAVFARAHVHGARPVANTIRVRDGLVRFHTRLAEPGRWSLWVELARGGRVTRQRFPLEIAPARPPRSSP